MKKVNWFISWMVTLSLVMSAFTAAANAETNQNITVELDGKVISFDVEPEIIYGRTMVPLRKIFEEIGALVKWDSDTQTVSARKSSKTITLTINSAEMQIDKGNTDEEGNAIVETTVLDVPPQIVSGRTLVPARAISEAFGLDVEWNNDTQTVIITSDSDEDDSWKENTGTINLSDLTYTGNGIEITGTKILITAGGDYTVTGTLEDGNITVKTKEKVKLRLSGASITSGEDPCIYFKDADKAYITVTEGTENYLTAHNSDKGAVYSKEKLEIKGSGTLTVDSASGHGIKVADNLTIENGTLNITAAGDGINVDNTFKMTDGTVNISAKGDGIASDSIVIINGGIVNIETTGEPIVPEASQAQTGSNFRGGMRGAASVEFETSSKGIKADWMLYISGGDITVKSADHAVHSADEIEITGGNLTLSSAYKKGIAGHGNVTVSGSDTFIDIKKSTEGIESKNVVTINDGTIKIVASDDGINSAGGKTGGMMGGMNMAAGIRPPMTEQDAAIFNRDHNTNSLPGDTRAQRRDFEDGKPFPGDAGFQWQNFAGGNGFASGNRGGMGGNQKDCIIVNGGNIEVTAGNDCFDANGNMILNGGTIKVITTHGALIGFDAVLDADGTITVGEAVTFIAAGKGGAQGIINASQNMITLYGEAAYNAGENICITDEAGNTMIEYSPKESFSVVVIASPYLKLEQTYTLSVGNDSHKLTLSEQNTVLGTEMKANSGWNKGMR